MNIDKMVKEGYLKAEPRTHGGSNDDYLIDFSASINPYGASKRVYNAIRSNLHLIERYPDPNAKRLKEAISNYLSIDIDNIIIGNGSNEIIHLFADIFINKNDKVIIPQPTFYEYEFASYKNSALLEFIHIDRLSDINIDAKVMFICNPNNPTGLLYDKSLMMRLVENAYNDSTLVMIDECFIEFVDNPLENSLVRYVNEYDNLIILRSFTKAFGLAGLRIGYAIASKDIAKIMNKVKVTWNTNALAQIAAIEALNDLDHIIKSKRLIKKELSYLKKNISKLGLYVYNSDVNFFLVKCDNSIKLKEELLKYNILVRDCSNFTYMSNDHIRISVKKRRDNIKLIDALSKVYGKVLDDSRYEF